MASPLFFTLLVLIIKKLKHEQHSFREVVEAALKEANLSPGDCSAVAVTNEPGREICLQIGLSFAKEFCRKHQISALIPVHHMKAHAVVARMCHPGEIQYPFMTLLISGGHCLIAVAQNSQQFYLMGESIDIAPGHFLDVVAKDMGVHSIEEFKVSNPGNGFWSRLSTFLIFCLK